jgi:hypothetical protein
VTQDNEGIFRESSDSSGLSRTAATTRRHKSPKVACRLAPAMSASQALDQASRHLLGAATATKRFEWIAVIGGFLAFFAAFGIGKLERCIVRSLKKFCNFADAPDRALRGMY